MRENNELFKRLEQEAEQIEIPASVNPENMRRRLEIHKRAKRRKLEKILAVAACFCLLLGCSLVAGQQGWLTKEPVHQEQTGETQGDFNNQEQSRESGLYAGTEQMAGTNASQVSESSMGQTMGRNNEMGSELDEQSDGANSEQQHSQGNNHGQLAEQTEEPSNIAAGLPYPEVTYEDIYASMSKVWEEEVYYYSATRGDTSVPTDLNESGALVVEAPVAEKSMNIQNAQMEAITDSAETLSADKAFGTTNVQTAGVEEGDIVKNDGRYLYQMIRVETEEGWEWAIQIVDTKDSLKELSRLGGFQSIEEFYIWEDMLVVIENKYLNRFETVEAKKGMMISSCDVIYNDDYYHEISFYDIGNRVTPVKINTFTLQGRYDSSRIADGYFYGFSRFYASPGEGEEDYDAYVPKVDGVRLEASQILLPEENAGTSYLVLVSVDLRKPTEFVQTTAVVSGGNLYYVSGENIYVIASKSAEMQEGWTSDTTSILRFAYGEGQFSLQAEGSIKGRLDDSFSLDEYNDHLRVVATVREYEVKSVKDDRTGEIIGSTMTQELQTNALYVLDESLKVVGSVEGLAEDEQIYSARFLGETGYFVTFRQTDPLFAVDLSDPTDPKILSELKISGFSEYLHFYGADRLLGIGMEADEETGQQEGMKLSMFDISDPTNVQEIAKLPLSDYYYSECLYNHRAVLISPQVNIFGFEAEGSNRGEYWKEYLLFSYEGEEFVQKLKIDTELEDGGYYTCRGTFIGKVFYLLSQDGSVRSYSLQTGEELETLTQLVNKSDTE